MRSVHPSKRKGLDLSQLNDKYAPRGGFVRGEVKKFSSPRLFKLAKPPIGYGPLICFVVIFFILINIFNVFLTITLSFTIGALFYLLGKRNRARRLSEKGIEETLYGDKGRAITLFEKALILDPKNYSILHLLGYTLATAKRFIEAIPYLERFLDVSYDYDTVVLLARCYRETEKLDQAVELLETIPESSARYPQGIFLLTKTYLEKGNLDKAKELAEKGLANIPTQRKRTGIDLRILLAEIYEKEGKLNKALSQYEKTLSSGEDIPEVSSKIKKLKEKLKKNKIR
jgi:tetratricopeptide (TPR) repeat protein